MDFDIDTYLSSNDASSIEDYDIDLDFTFDVINNELNKTSSPDSVPNRTEPTENTSSPKTNPNSFSEVSQTNGRSHKLNITGTKISKDLNQNDSNALIITMNEVEGDSSFKLVSKNNKVQNLKKSQSKNFSSKCNYYKNNAHDVNNIENFIIFKGQILLPKTGSFTVGQTKPFKNNAGSDMIKSEFRKKRRKQKKQISKQSAKPVVKEKDKPLGATNQRKSSQMLNFENSQIRNSNEIDSKPYRVSFESNLNTNKSIYNLKTNKTTVETKHFDVDRQRNLVGSDLINSNESIINLKTNKTTVETKHFDVDRQCNLGGENTFHQSSVKRKLDECRIHFDENNNEEANGNFMSGNDYPKFKLNYFRNLRERIERIRRLPLPVKALEFESDNNITDCEKLAMPEFFTSQLQTRRYLQMRNHILVCWKGRSSTYLNKTFIRKGLKGYDVNVMSIVHEYLQRIGAINFIGCQKSNLEMKSDSPVNLNSPS